MAIRAFQGKQPKVDPSAFVEGSAQVIGQVELGPQASVWFNAVVRGDIDSIRVGAQSNVQDLCCLHVTRGFPVFVGQRVTVGHGVTLHGCTVGDDCLIGMGAIVLDGAQIGAGCLVGAGALVVPGTKVPPGSLVLGSPAKVVRQVTAEEKARLVHSYTSYLALCTEYARAGG